MVSINFLEFFTDIAPIVKASFPSRKGIRIKDSLTNVGEPSLSMTLQKSSRIALLPISIEANLRLSFLV